MLKTVTQPSRIYAEGREFDLHAGWAGYLIKSGMAEAVNVDAPEPEPEKPAPEVKPAAKPIFRDRPPTRGKKR
ncbi:MAG TPA: hypothetical protein PLS90_14425 [Candidatus Sumerlaeota bacterium]|nr:hypothetical protein [Candidatus Sumerlaeota bacterium]HPK03640.1 hypothetical protein [Candidatus Sumerlaeota bacterium]